MQGRTPTASVLSKLFLLSGICSSLLFSLPSFGQTSSAQTADEDSTTDSPPVSSFQDTPDDVGYDTIVNNLNRQVSASEQATSRARAAKPKADPFDNVLMHAGAGLSVMSESLSFADGGHAIFNGRGFQASLGIDLFSINWVAEGTVRSFDNNDDHNTQMSLREFELKVFYKDRFAKAFGYRLGAGISGRYLTVQRSGLDTIEQSTPSSVLTAGIDFFATDKVSFGLDLSGRTAMISDSIDRGSVDGTVRVDANF